MEGVCQALECERQRRFSESIRSDTLNVAVDLVDKDVEESKEDVSVLLTGRQHDVPS